MSLFSIFNSTFKSSKSSNEMSDAENIGQNATVLDENDKKKINFALAIQEKRDRMSYMVYEDFNLYLNEADSLIAYIEQSIGTSLDSDPIKALIESFIRLVGPIPSVDDKQDSIFIHSLKLFRFMVIVAKDNTYLFNDYKKECVLICLLSIAFVHELDNLVFFKIEALPGAISFNPIIQSLDKFVEANDARALLIEKRSSALSFEKSFSLGAMLFSKQLLGVFIYLKENDAYDLALRLLLYKSSDPLYNVFVKAHDLTLQRIQHDKNELFEALRPRFVGIDNTPANWYELNAFVNLTPVYDEKRLFLIDVHKQVDFAYCLSRKWALDLVALQQKVSDSLQKTTDLKERLKDSELFEPYKEKRKKLKEAFVDSLKPIITTNEEQNISISATSISTPLESIENKTDKSDTSGVNIDDKLTNLVIEEKIIESHTSNHLIEESALNDVIFSSEAINNRYCFDNQLNSIVSVSNDDDKDLKAFKTVIKKLIDISSGNCEIQKELDKRIKRFRQVLEVILGFAKDGSFKLEYDLDNALKNAKNFNDLFITTLATYHAAMKNYVDNKVGISYLNKFIKAEVKRFSSL